ncbi:hypothetical protein EDC01DRAFT_7507 [Geopyxis carbonaria]|nr:hypothetical protein EDC01DRAFT_7507 [Geopyxis carbonaria]
MFMLCLCCCGLCIFGPGRARIYGACQGGSGGGGGARARRVRRGEAYRRSACFRGLYRCLGASRWARQMTASLVPATRATSGRIVFICWRRRRKRWRPHPTCSQAGHMKRGTQDVGDDGGWNQMEWMRCWMGGMQRGRRDGGLVVAAGGLELGGNGDDRRLTWDYQ